VDGKTNVNGSTETGRVRPKIVDQRIYSWSRAERNIQLVGEIVRAVPISAVKSIRAYIYIYAAVTNAFGARFEPGGGGKRNGAGVFGKAVVKLDALRRTVVVLRR